MCGIVGTVHLDSTPIDLSYVQAAANMLRRRGPDDAGVWAGENVGLGHRRLAVLDLTTSGHQPMHSHDGRYVITYNGEIYNFRELRRELGSAMPWRSESDTEVILAAYAHWGASCLDRFHGMFAFVIWDRQERTLFAARDRMGVKPFYYSYSGNRFIFASRPRAIFAMQPQLTHDFDAQALRLYLESGYIPAPYSIYRSVRKLPPAHYLLLDAQGVHIKRYWDFRSIMPEASLARCHDQELLEQLDAIMERSIRMRLVSDVPLGAFLSGGIDSSLVVALMARHATGKVKTFTIGFEEQDYDESSDAECVARHLETEHYCELLRVDDLLALMPMFAEEYDEPFFDSSAFPTLAVSRMTRQKVTVALSGDGGDELFGGYHYYRIARWLEPFFSLPVGMRRILRRTLGLMPQHNFKLLAEALGKKNGASAFAFARSIAKDFHGVLKPEVNAGTFGMLQIFAEAATSFPPKLPAGERGMRLDGLYTLPDDYLQKVDVASMAYSLEVREPMLDHELVEFAMRLPESFKLRGGKNKYLLRQLAYRYVPRKLLDRPKRGFGVPIHRWLRGPLREWALERFNSDELFSLVPLDQKRVLELYRLHESGARNVYPLLWAVLMLLNFVAVTRTGSASSN